MISEEQKQQIFTLRSQGCGLLKISSKLNLSLATISLWCNRFDPDKKYNQTNKLKEQDKNEIIEFYQNSKNLGETGKKFKDLISTRGIRDFLIRRNIYIARKQPTEKQISRRKSLAVINWKKDKKLKLIEYKGGKCEKCDYNKCYKALDFHHKDPNLKSFDVSANSYSFAKMKEEADKCMLLCANCHRELHAGFWKVE